MWPNCFCNGDRPCCLSWMSFKTEDTFAVHSCIASNCASTSLIRLYLASALLEAASGP